MNDKELADKVNEESISAGLAIRIARLWRVGKMIGGDEDEVREALLREVERLTIEIERAGWAMSDLRQKLETALAKPEPESRDDIGDMEYFYPWEDVIQGIYGSYSSECDYLMISALEAVRDRTTFDLIKEHGIAAELVLYILAGHGLTEYGTSPRGGWPDPAVEDLWQPLIDKWEAYADVAWERVESTK